MNKLELADLPVDTTFSVLAITENDVTVFGFKILEKGEQPICELSEKLPADTGMHGPVRVQVLGCVETDEPLGEYIELENIAEDDPTIPLSIGILSVGGLIAVLDSRHELVPIPQVRHIISPAISHIVINS